MRRRSPALPTASSLFAMGWSSPCALETSKIRVIEKGSVRLFRSFILRRLAQEPIRTGLSIVGIALGVAVVLAIQMANRSALEGFRAALDTIAGKTSLEVAGAGVGVDERTLASLGWLRKWGDVSPVVEGDAMAVSATGRGEAVRVLGVDILKDQPFREYQLLHTASSGRG